MVTMLGEKKMKKYNVISFVILATFLLLFNLIVGGLSLGGIEQVIHFVMIILALLGLVTALKGEGWIKWILVTLNAVLFIIISYATIASLFLDKAIHVI